MGKIQVGLIMALLFLAAQAEISFKTDTTVDEDGGTRLTTDMEIYPDGFATNGSRSAGSAGGARSAGGAGGAENEGGAARQPGLVGPPGPVGPVGPVGPEGPEGPCCVIPGDEYEGQGLNKTIEAIVKAEIKKQIDTNASGSSESGASIDTLLKKLESLQQEVDKYHAPGLSPSNPAASCADMLAQNPNISSGYYWIGTEGNSMRQYCNMTLSCGGITGGWMRVAELDMTDGSQQCPSGLKPRIDSGKRSCVKIDDGAGCASFTFPMTLDYSKVCGKIIGYQIGSTDAFSYHGSRNERSSIEENYVDGVSLTHGNPRQHIWTFASAEDEIASTKKSACSCTNPIAYSEATPPPPYVGHDYFCDTGSTGHYSFGVFYGANPLWDGAGCGPQDTCCAFNNPPWFYKQLPQSTSDNIEMRLCRDQGRGDEDLAIGKFEIYAM